MAVTYPGAGIDGRSGNIMGGGVSKGGDFVIGHSASAKFTETRLAGYSAWMITTEVQEGEAKMQLTFGHGSPFVYGKISGGNPVIRFAHKPIIWSGKQGESVLESRCGEITTEFLARVAQNGWERRRSMKTRIERVLLGSASARQGTCHPWGLRQCAHNHIVMTKVSSSHEKGTLSSIYEVETKKLEGKGEGTIFALYPHQWKYTSTPLTSMSYRSVRGAMKVAKGSSFETGVPIQGLLPMFPKEGIPDLVRMKGYLTTEAAKRKRTLAILIGRESISESWPP